MSVTIWISRGLFCELPKCQMHQPLIGTLQASIAALKYLAWVNECLNAVYLVSVLYRDLVSPGIDSWNQKYETERSLGIKVSREEKKTTDDLEVGIQLIRPFSRWRFVELFDQLVKLFDAQRMRTLSRLVAIQDCLIL